MSSVVLDASAVLAIAFREPGMEMVVERLADSVMSTVNLEEVVAELREKNIAAESIQAILNALPTQFIGFSMNHAYLAASLKHRCRPHGIGIADRACMALAIELGRPVLTADRNWLKVEVDVPVELIR